MDDFEGCIGLRISITFTLQSSQWRDERTDFALGESSKLVNFVEAKCDSTLFIDSDYYYNNHSCGYHNNQLRVLSFLEFDVMLCLIVEVTSAYTN
jgi:hypothetical protein